MEYQKYLAQKKQIYESLLQFIENNEESNDDYFYQLNELYKEQKII